MRRTLTGMKLAWSLVRGYRKILLVLMALMVFSVSLSPYLLPRTIQVGFNAMQDGTPRDALHSILVLLVMFTLLLLSVAWMNIYGDTWATRLDLHKKMNSLGRLHDQFVSNIISEQNPGEVFNKITSGCRTSIGLWFQLGFVLAGSVTIVLMLGISYSAGFGAFVLFLCVPILVILRVWFENRFLVKFVTMRQNANNTRFNLLHETIRHSELLHQFGATEWGAKRYAAARQETINADLKHTMTKSVFAGIEDLSIAFFQSLLAVYFVRPSVGWGDVGATFAALSGLSGASSTLRASVSNLPRATVPLEQLNSLLNQSEIEVQPCNTIELSDVCYSKGNETILKNINIRIEKGEKVAVMGHNGSGKSTLMRIIAAQLKATSGTARLPYIDCAARRTSVAYAPAYNFLFNCTAKENLLMGAHSGLSKDGFENLAKTLVLDECWETLPENLSLGQLRRVNLGRAIINQNADVFIYDEPTAGLDGDTAHRILGNMTNTDKTVIYVTHDIDMAKYASRTIVMKKGTVDCDSRVSGMYSEAVQMEAVAK